MHLWSGHFPGCIWRNGSNMHLHIRVVRVSSEKRDEKEEGEGIQKVLFLCLRDGSIVRYIIKAEAEMDLNKKYGQLNCQIDEI